MPCEIEIFPDRRGWNRWERLPGGPYPIDSQTMTIARGIIKAWGIESLETLRNTCPIMLDQHRDTLAIAVAAPRCRVIDTKVLAALDSFKIA